VEVSSARVQRTAAAAGFRDRDRRGFIRRPPLRPDPRPDDRFRGGAARQGRALSPRRWLVPTRTRPLRSAGPRAGAWTPEQYLAEVPYLAKAKMNFLMNCYTSMFHERQPFVKQVVGSRCPRPRRKGFEAVVRACQEERHFSFLLRHAPQLFSERAPRPWKRRGLRGASGQHYAWAQGLGVRWFSVSYDEHRRPQARNKSRLGEAQAELVKQAPRPSPQRRTRRPSSSFCPVYYMGCGDKPEAQSYFRGAVPRPWRAMSSSSGRADDVVPPQSQ